MNRFSKKELKQLKANMEGLSNDELTEFMKTFSGIREHAPDIYLQLQGVYDEVAVFGRRIRNEAV